jgi:hypothetical protein
MTPMVRQLHLSLNLLFRRQDDRGTIMNWSPMLYTHSMIAQLSSIELQRRNKSSYRREDNRVGLIQDAVVFSILSLYVFRAA